MANTALTILVLLSAVLLGFYQLFLSSVFESFGLFRDVQLLGTRDCITVPELQACEKSVLHSSTGLLYLACSTPQDRLHWLAGRPQINLISRNQTDYVATYDPATSRVTRLDFEGFATSNSITIHGIDVVASELDPKVLFVYLVNHRSPPNPLDFSTNGADSVIEVFQTTEGSTKLRHIKTFYDPSVIVLPNDVAGSIDGKSVYFTNSHSSKMPFASLRILATLFKPSSSVGFCHVDEGCRMAISMPDNHGIVRAPNNTFYVANGLTGGFRILDKQEDNSLVLADEIKTDYPVDNLSIDVDGVVWASAFPKMLNTSLHMQDFSWTMRSPSTVLTLSINTGPESFFGKKYKVEKVFEDDGTLVSGATTSVHDARRHRLFMHGLLAPWLTVCNV